MNLKLIITEIPLDRVHLDTHPSTIVKEKDLARLQDSLTAVGLLSFPRVRPLDDGWWQPVTGWKRFKAARLLGWSTIPAVVLDPETPEVHLLLLYLHDNAFSRTFNPLEQAWLAQRLLAHWDRDTLVAKGLPLLGLPPAPAQLERLLAAARLEKPWQELVAAETLALSAAARLAAWAPTDRLAALPFLATLPFSQSKQEEFLAGVEILARREGMSRADILAGQELHQDLLDPTLTLKERGETVRRRLNERVSPRLTAARKTFTAGLDRLGLKRHPRLRLKEPPAFEGPDFELSLKFRDHRELKDILQELVRLAGRPEFEALLDI